MDYFVWLGHSGSFTDPNNWDDVSKPPPPGQAFATGVPTAGDAIVDVIGGPTEADAPINAGGATVAEADSVAISGGLGVTGALDGIEQIPGSDNNSPSTGRDEFVDGTYTIGSVGAFLNVLSVQNSTLTANAFEIDTSGTHTGIVELGNSTLNAPDLVLGDNKNTGQGTLQLDATSTVHINGSAAVANGEIDTAGTLTISSDLSSTGSLGDLTLSGTSVMHIDGGLTTVGGRLNLNGSATVAIGSSAPGSLRAGNLVLGDGTSFLATDSSTFSIDSTFVADGATLLIEDHASGSFALLSVFGTINLEQHGNATVTQLEIGTSTSTAPTVTLDASRLEAVDDVEIGSNTSQTPAQLIVTDSASLLIDSSLLVATSLGFRVADGSLAIVDNNVEVAPEDAATNTISGSNTRFTIDGALAFDGDGANSFGAVQIQQQAAMTAGEVDFEQTGGALASLLISDTATLNVTGTGIAFDDSGTDTSALLTIQGGAQAVVANAVDLNPGDGAFAGITVTDAGSELLVGETTFVGENEPAPGAAAGLAALTIKDTASVELADLVVSPAGVVTASGGDLQVFGSATGSGVIGIEANGRVGIGAGASGVRLQFNDNTGSLVLADPAAVTSAITGFQSGDTIGIDSFVATSDTYANNSLVLTDAGNHRITLALTTLYAQPVFTLASDNSGGTNITVSAGTPPGPQQSPAVLNNFGWAQGWGSPDNPRFTADVNGDGSTDYLGFGFNAVFIGYGGTFAGADPSRTGPGFSAAGLAVQDFGTNEGYTSVVQRGVAATGAGVGDVIFGQGFAGVFWYAATSATPQTDAAGNTYNVLQYQSSPNFYGNFGSQQGWTPDNGFQILKSTSTDAFASVLGFGSDGIVVGPQAFAPGATAASSYLIPLGAGNNSGWSQSVDVRTFTDVGGKTIDLNHDGIADFVGMGPNGLAFAFGNDNGPSGSYQLGPLQNAQINGSADDLGEVQGWTDSTTLRYVVFDPQTGYDDIIAFGNAGVLVAPGQDPATHNGQPFGQLYLAMPDFGANQGWSVGQTPRLVGDVNGDGVPDIVGFGASNTFVALGTRDAGGALHFALAPSQTIGDFGFTEGWSGSNPQTIRALANFPNSGGGTHADLVLSGAFNTQLWQFGQH